MLLRKKTNPKHSTRYYHNHILPSLLAQKFKTSMKKPRRPSHPGISRQAWRNLTALPSPVLWSLTFLSNLKSRDKPEEVPPLLPTLTYETAWRRQRNWRNLETSLMWPRRSSQPCTSRSHLPSQLQDLRATWWYFTSPFDPDPRDCPLQPFEPPV